MSTSLKFKVTSDSSDDEDVEDRSSDLNGLSLEKLDLCPRKKLLVLCLGGFLVERKRSPYGVQYGSRRPDFVCGNFLVYKRPFLDEFLKFCFQKFEVGIWASAMEHNVSPVMSYLTYGLSRRFAFVWSQEECRDSGYGSLEKKTKPIFLKELKKIWDNQGRILPWPKGTYSSANTLLIDTDPSKALLNLPNTAIFPHEYKGDQKSADAVLGPEGELQAFLKGLEDTDNVTSYVKEHRFGQQEISPSHPDWKYYEKIISYFK